MRRRAAAASADGLCALGVLCHLGKGTAQDDKRAAELFRKAADMGLPRAWYFLGKSYDAGYGVEENDEQAFKCYLSAAEGVYPGCALSGGALLYIRARHGARLQQGVFLLPPCRRPRPRGRNLLTGALL